MCGIFGVISSSIEKENSFHSSQYIQSRGPDRTLHISGKEYFLAFHRLSIMNTSPLADQPFVYEYILPNGTRENYIVMCNGEIYNYKQLLSLYLPEREVRNDIDSIYYLFEHFHFHFAKLNEALNGEYALVIIKFVDDEIKTMWMSTDTSSVRPLFVYTDIHTVAFSSLLIGLTSLLPEKCNGIQRLKGGDCVVLQFTRVSEGLRTLGDEQEEVKDEKNKIQIYSELQYNYIPAGMNEWTNIKHTLENKELYSRIVNTLEQAVKCRLFSDREMGCLLSGGLDSSLVASIAADYLQKNGGKKLRTFSIGMSGGTDLKYARMVADHIGSEHTEILFTPEEGLSLIDDVIKCCETYDITTIRASIPQHLLARYISKHTDIKVVLNGDGADECEMGYLYFYNSPNWSSAHLDSNRLVDEIHLYDGLRVDRNLSHWGLEARVPFLDKHFVGLYKSIHPALKVPVPSSRPEKYLIRKAFEVIVPDLLPREVLYRTKEAFSDAVSSREKSWYLMIQDYIGEKKGMTEREYYSSRFDEWFGRDCRHVIPHYWMPSWSQTDDPSARTLDVYLNTVQDYLTV